MTDTDGPQYRSTYTHAAEGVTLRDADEDDMMDIRVPIASTGDVRNEGDDPLTTAELRGMAEQVDSLTRGVFPEHGNSDVVDFAGYSQFEKLGYWANAEVEREASADGEDLLVATARMPDPETLLAATGDYREALAILKEQAKRGIPIGSSIGWRDDEDAPGGVDLMEASIVGIGADPRTVSEGGEQLVARAAVEAGADPEALLDAVREAVGMSDEDTHDMTDEDTPDEGTTDEEQTAEADTEQSAEDEQTHERGDEECPECEASVRSDANYCRECGTDLREGDEDDEEGDEDDEDEDDEDEQAADEPDAEQSADTSDLEERLAALEDELAAVRSGEVDIDTPDPDDTEEEREAEDDTDEQRDTSDPADKPDWARID